MCEKIDRLEAMTARVREAAAETKTAAERLCAALENTKPAPINYAAVAGAAMPMRVK